MKKRRVPKKGAARPKKPEPPKKRAPSKKAELRKAIRERGISAVAKARKRHPDTLRRWLREGLPDPVRSAVAKITANPHPAWLVRYRKSREIERADDRREKAQKQVRRARAKRNRERRELARAAQGFDRKEGVRRAAQLKAMAPKFVGMSQVDILLWAEEYDYDLEEVWDAYDEQ